MKPHVIPQIVRKNPTTLVVFLYSLLITGLWLESWMETGRGNTASGAAVENHPSPGSRGRDGKAEPHWRKGSPSVVTELAPKAEAPRMDWAGLESTDFATYVANLRVSGCPEETVRRIVTAEVREAFDEERVKRLDEETIPFWDAGYNANESERPVFEKLAADEGALLASLLGSEGVSAVGDPSDRIPSTWRFGPKLAAKRQAVTEIFARADTLREATLASIGDGELLPIHQETLAQIEAEKAAALAATLSDEEQLEFEIRNSALADELRALLQTEGRQASEGQFRAMFQARKALALEIEAAAVSGAELGGAWTNYQGTIGSILEAAANQEG